MLEKHKENEMVGGGTRTDVLPGALGAQGAFEGWMTRRSLRFASRIAFRCVLHPHGNQDIRRWKLFPVLLSLFKINVSITRKQ